MCYYDIIMVMVYGINTVHNGSYNIDIISETAINKLERPIYLCRY